MSGAEAEVLKDFLDFVERNHGDLGPFTRLRVCGRNRYRILRRLRSVLEEVLGGPATVERNQWARWELPQGETVRYVFLALEQLDGNAEVQLRLYPGDTLGQARQLFRDQAAPARKVVEALGGGWEIAPNFHLGHIQTGFGWAGSPSGLAAYVDYWADHVGMPRSCPRTAGTR